MRPVVTVVTVAVASLAALAACKSQPKVQVVFEEADAEPAGTRSAPGEEALREAYEKSLEARANAPEPDVDPGEPRERYELVWRLGKDRLRSIYGERAEMIALLERIKLDDKAEQKVLDTWIPRLTEFGIGREAASMERAPADICKTIGDVRTAAAPLIEAGTKELERIEAQTAELDELADAGGTVYQKQWDKIEEERKRWSAPVRAGKQMLLVVRSILDEAYVLADLGPRRAQVALRDCLTPLAGDSLGLDLADDQLQKVLERSRWYRELR